LYIFAADDELPPLEDELPLDEEPPPELAAQANPAGTASASPIAMADEIKNR
jgi:hypothetical protein